MSDLSEQKMELIRRKSRVIKEADEKIVELQSTIKSVRKAKLRLALERDELINSEDVQLEIPEVTEDE